LRLVDQTGPPQAGRRQAGPGHGADTQGQAGRGPGRAGRHRGAPGVCRHSGTDRGLDPSLLGGRGHRLRCPAPCDLRWVRGARGPGDFGCIAMRPDAGKATLLTSELTFMAPQCPDGRPVFWFNNEGPGRRIVGRLWQSALDATFEDLAHMRTKGELRSAYASAVGGSDRVKVLDIHDAHSSEIEDIIRKHRPYIIVLDMIDNIRFAGVANNGGQRTDQLLEAMYQWARVLGVKYDCIVLCTSQISAEGEGLTRPLMSMLKDSKTGKQGAVDFLLMGGKSNDPLMANSRWINLPKNKLARTGKPGDPYGYEVILDTHRGRYRMPEEVSDDE